MNDAIKLYVKSLQEKVSLGDDTEHTHRPAIQALLESLGKDLLVSNDPKQIAVGAPDFVVRKKVAREVNLPVGYVETKKIGEDLSKTEKSEQLERYLHLSNLILTDYLEFRWYVGGQKRMTVKLGEKSGKKIKLAKDGEAQLIELLESFLAQKVTDIGTPKELAARMAGICKNIDRMIMHSFTEGAASELMKDLKNAFERTLLPDITDAQFADMFAQTLGYGLFAARIHHAQKTPTPNPFPVNGEGEEERESALPSSIHGGRAGDGGAFTRTGAAREIPKSNPFLRNLFDTMHSADLDDEPFIGFVDDLTAVLAHTNMGAVLAQFGKRTKQEDPILHFYETFLSEYDPKERKRRGVYYTPEPVVSYIVRSVDILLKEKFGLKDGLADTSTVEVEVKEGDNFVKRKLPKVLILDPACGTGTFLYAVVDLIRTRFMEQNRAGEWQSFVREHLIPRIYGFELQMAPYAVAHLKLAMQLSGHDLTEAQRERFGYEFQNTERLNVYLTNSLEETLYKTEELLGTMKIISQEANAAATVKNRLPILVVLGNPPYSGHSANSGAWISKLIRDYYFLDGEPLGEKNPKWLQDDYVKFIRYGQWRIGQWTAGGHSAHGILAFITNHSYLDNPTFRGMRRSLQKTFDEIYLLDLHGNSKKKEQTPSGGKDENVFDIQQGVSVGLFVKSRSNSEATIKRSDLWGKRDEKYDWLSSRDHKHTKWKKLEPSKPFYLFTERDADSEEEYHEGFSIQDVLNVNSVGIVTARDELVVRWNPDESFQIAQRFAQMDTEEARKEFNLGADVRDWKVQWAQQDVLESGVQPEFVTSILYRPFDIRHAYYTGHSRGFMCYPRTEVMRHMLAGENLAILTTRQTKEIWSPYVSRHICTHKSASVYDISSVFPLYLYSEDGKTRKPNLDAKFVSGFASKLGLKFVEEGARWTPTPNPFPVNGEGERDSEFGSLPPFTGEGLGKGVGKSGDGGMPGDGVFGPEDVFYYIYAIFHSPTYRERYKEFLKIDFPRVPLTSNLELFSKLVPLGYELVQYHLLEHPNLDSTPVVFPERGSNIVERVQYVDTLERVTINKEQYFEKVTPEVWNFHVGGYQVCQKWLKDRKDRTLTHDEIKHYEKTVMALGETIRLMKAIDRAIPEWPIT